MNAPLTAENLDVYPTAEGILLDTTVLGYLRSAGYPVNGIKELHTVKTEDSDTGHVVAKVETTTKPSDDPELDLVADKTCVWLCDGWHFRSECWPDLREFGNTPNDIGHCKHIKEVLNDADM